MFELLLILNEIFFRNILMSLHFLFVFCTLVTQNEGQKNNVICMQSKLKFTLYSLLGVLCCSTHGQLYVQLK